MKTATRTIRLERKPADTRPGKVVITEAGKSTSYLFTCLPSQIGGRAFQMAKVEAKETEGQTDLRIAERYDVLVNGKTSSCTCKWGTYGKGKPCRHLAGLRKLLADGKLS